MEEKPMGVVNEVVCDHIPDDLAISILSKLPLKSFKRFGCVRKSWTLLFENLHFMSMYRNNFTETSLLLKQVLPGEEYHSVFYLLSGERFEHRFNLDLPPPFQDDGNAIHVLGSSVNGILCLHQAYTRIVLWNPATGEFKVVPPSPVEFGPPYREPYIDFNGFGYDDVRDDYKVVRCVAFSILDEDELDRLGVPYDGPWDLENISFEPMWEIYSLRSNSWRKLDCQMPKSSFYHTNGARVYTDKVCHWWGTTKDTEIATCLVSFDLSNEVLFTTPMPPYMGDATFDFGLMQVHLAVLNGSVAFICNYAEKTTFEVSILAEVGVKESWIKLFIVGPISCVENLIGAGKMGNVFFRKKDDELVWYDWSTHMIVELGLKGKKWLTQIVIYKENFESLISIGFEK